MVCTLVWLALLRLLLRRTRDDDTMNTRPMSAPVGLVIDGLDVRTVADVAELNQLFVQHKVLVFPNQSLSPQQQKEFGAKFGELVRHPYASMPDHPEIIELVNKGKRRDVNQHWHTDMSYNPQPPKLTMLYALEVPSIGGDTAFANQVLAYDALSDGFKRTLEGLVGINTARGLAKLYGEDPKNAPSAEHRIVRTHEESGERALYVCQSFTERVKGWSREESQALLDFLFVHSVRPEFQGRHQWRPGDLVMWDNRALLHFAVHDHGDEPRRIHRLQVVG